MENFGRRKLWRIDHQQKLVNNILANVLDYIAHVIQNDSAVEKEQQSFLFLSANVTKLALLCNVLVSHGWSRASSSIYNR